MRSITSAISCIWDGRGGWTLIRRWLTSLEKVKTFFYEHTLLRCCIYGLIAAALLAAWALSDGTSVAFVYNEF